VGNLVAKKFALDEPDHNSPFLTQAGLVCGCGWLRLARGDHKHALHLLLAAHFIDLFSLLSAARLCKTRNKQRSITRNIN